MLRLEKSFDLILERESTQVGKTAGAGNAVRVCITAILIFAVLYAFFLFLHIEFPYVQSGADLVTNYKHNLAHHGRPFKTPRGPATGDPANGRLHVMSFGYSKMLAALIPSKFEMDMAALGYPAVEAYNFGLPGDSRFVADLEAMAARNTAPDVALLTFAWPEGDPNRVGLFRFLMDDEAIVKTLFPFRTLPRDTFIMLAEARGVKGFKQKYLQNEAAVNQVIADRGYYFMWRQSHYPNHQLPSGFRQDSDTPNVVAARLVPLGEVYARLAPILAEHHIQCILVPNYYREGEYAAPPPLNAAAARAVAMMPDVSLVGPDYWLYSPNLFSDPTHLNPHGAEIYTKQLAGLLASWLTRHRPR